MKTQTIDLGGGPAHYADFGGLGDPLLLIHGLGGAHVNWAAVGPRLAHSRRVVALDLIGSGLTPRAGRSSSLESNRLHVDTFITEVLGGHATLMGNSMGGLLTILEAAARPEKVRAAVLVDSALPRPRNGAHHPLAVAFLTAFLVPGMGEMVMTSRRGVPPDELVARTLALVAASPSTIAPEIVEMHHEMARRRHGAWDADRAFLQASRSLAATLARKERFHDRVRRIRCPTLILHGAHDRLVPVEAARELAAARPDWGFHVFESLGHVPQLEDPAAFLSVVEPWLEGALGSSGRLS